MSRKPTHADAELLIRLYELRRDPELRMARKWFLTEFQPRPWEEIKSTYLTHTDEDRWFRMTFSYWEMLAALVNRGVLHDELFFESTGEDIVTWEKIKPWIEGARAAVRPTFLHNYEKLVKDHVAFRTRINAVALKKTAGNGAPRSNGRPAKRRAKAATR